MSNIVIIGMPGSGKTTFGQRLALESGLSFVDTDVLMEERFGTSLQTVVNRRGLNFMRALEEEVICALDVADSVVATGGSVVYSEAAMRHLSTLGKIVYLRISVQTLVQRVSRAMARGLFKYPATSLQELYFERRALYELWADVTLENDRPLTALQFESLLKTIEKGG